MMKSLVRTARAVLPQFIKKPVKRFLTALLSEGPDQNWHRNAVGGMWEEIGKLQFEFLVAQGLKPSHYLLDVGCGSLRGGSHFIRYLEAGHYFGIDQSQEILEAGRNIELVNQNLLGKKPVLVQMGDFEFPSLNQQFDFALAQSVFTHLPLNNIIRCMMKMEKVLVRGGRFYATIFENPRGKLNLDPIVRSKAEGQDFTYFDKDCFHYDVETFRWICQGTSLSAKYIGEWNHPRDQMMLVFEKA